MDGLDSCHQRHCRLGKNGRVEFDVINHHNLLQFPKTNMTGWNYFAVLRQSFAEAIKCQYKSEDEIYLIWGNRAISLQYIVFTKNLATQMQKYCRMFISFHPPNQTNSCMKILLTAGRDSPWDFLFVWLTKRSTGFSVAQKLCERQSPGIMPDSSGTYTVTDWGRRQDDKFWLESYWTYHCWLMEKWL
jgi:hypothetical protein